MFDFPSLRPRPADPQLTIRPQAHSTRAGSEPPLARTQWKHSYFSVSLWCTLSKTFLLLSSLDQRLLLFVLLLLILFSTLIAQSSLTMTLMLMRRWRGYFNEQRSRSEGLVGGYREGIGSTEHQNTASTPASAFHQPWPFNEAAG